jgi:hypothetical protein
MGAMPVTRRPLAVFTIAQDEREFLPKWLEHYSRHVPTGDIFVLHHELPRQPTDVDRAWLRPQLGHHVVPAHHATSFDHAWLAGLAGRFQEFLLESYEWVLFAEADELIVPVDGTLTDYVEAIDDRRVSSVRCDGYEVVHGVDEQPLQTARPWLMQRRWWYRSSLYSKVLLARRPLRWVPGFHAPGCDSVPPPLPDDRLVLVHLKKIDFALAMARALRTASRVWPDRDVEARHGWQNRITTESEMRAYFETCVDTGEPVADLLREMPKWLRSVA